MDNSHHLLILIVSTLLLVFLVKCFRNSKSTGKYPPSPPALPFIGHLHLLKSRLPTSLENLAKRYGPLMRLRLGATEFVVASDEKSARQILKTFDADFASKFAPGPTTFHIYKDGYFVGAPYNAYWKFMKTLCMTKLFTGSQLARFIGIGEDETCKLIKSLLKRSKAGEPCDLTEELSEATNNMIYRMMVGRRCSKNLGQAAEIRKFILDSLKHAAKFHLGEMFGPLKKFDLFGNGKKIKSALMGYDQLIEQIMKGYEDNDLDNCGNDHEKDVMDILLETYKDTNAKVKLTREHIKNFFMEIIMASVDTIVAAIRTAMAEVINHPDVLKRLREEIDLVVGNRLINESDAAKLPYLQAVAMETLRLHHPSPTLRRLSRKDSKINGFDIKEGTKVFINIYTIMRDPNRYEEPEKFMPERFLDNCTEMKAQDFHYIPFGSGRRACPGSYLAIPVMHLAIGSLVQCFDWKVKDGEKADNKARGTGYSGACPSALVCYPKARFNPFEE
ncbi:cytochrome P450, family 712, subfamily A, polypeptide 2 [Hibiscus trionum]|uniref:Cytochrome P450, family 712, subfamily A, polypeptide 2 n=1 Tax=Hibiscus trionum TaxID=183268 RepID=A0A9W7HDE1_HIBTR|nr:cytochrome P450, family 712, subfamily A, polypeptide 2 [Hibiscus trionum]